MRDLGFVDGIFVLFISFVFLLAVTAHLKIEKLEKYHIHENICSECGSYLNSEVKR